MYRAKFNLFRWKNAWNSSNHRGYSEEISTIRYKDSQSTRHPILWFASVLSMFGAFEDEMSERFTDSPLMASPGLCCGSAGSGSRPWPASGPSPAWTGPPYHEGCTCSSAAAQGAQRTCIWGHSPMTSLLAPLSCSDRQHVFFGQFSERSVQTSLDSRFSSVFNFTKCEWQIPSPCPPLAFNRSGRGERVTATVSSGNIWWARQTQKGSFENSRKRENVRVQEWAGWVWKVEHLLGWRSVKCVRKYTRSLRRVLNDKYLFCCLARLNTLINVK